MVNEAASQQKAPFIPQQLYKTPEEKPQPQVVYQPRKRRRRRWTKKKYTCICRKFLWVGGVFFGPKDEGVDGIQAYLKTLRYVVQDPHDIQQNSSSNVTLRIFLIEGMFFCQFYPYPWSLFWFDLIFWCF